MSIGLILVIILIVFLFGGFSGRFGGYGYGYGHGGIGIIGIILIVLLVLGLTGLLWSDPRHVKVLSLKQRRLAASAQGRFGACRRDDEDEADKPIAPRAHDAAC